MPSSPLIIGELGLATRNIWTSHGHSFILSIKHKHTSIVRIFLSLLRVAHKPWKINTIVIGLRLTSFYLYIYSDKWETSLSLKTVVSKLLAPGRNRIVTVGLTTKHISRDIQKISLFLEYQYHLILQVLAFRYSVAVESYRNFSTPSPPMRLLVFPRSVTVTN